MRGISDVLTVSFDIGSKDESAFCVTRIHKGKVRVLKVGYGEQADTLYHFLTEQVENDKIKEGDSDE